MRDTPTPETDAAAWTETNWANACVTAEFARKLERELAEARATCSELVTDSNAITLAQTIVRITQELAEAREKIAGCSTCSVSEDVHRTQQEQIKSTERLEIIKHTPKP